MSPTFSIDGLPSYLFGTFDWLMHGVIIRETPPIDLCTREALDDPNPWVVLAAVMEHAKVGDHEHVPQLARFFESPLHALDRVALLMTGLLAESSQLGLLETALEHPQSQTRCLAAAAARDAGQLRLVPAMLRTWQAADHHRDRVSIAQYICDLLEAPWGPLLEESAFYNLPPVDLSTLSEGPVREFAARQNAREPLEELFPERVLARCRELSAQHGGDDVCLWEGEPRHPHQVARACLEALRTERTSLGLAHHRRVLEASTAVSCVDFFEWDRPRRMDIQVILHDFLETDPARYEAGRRYFWNHVIA